MYRIFFKHLRSGISNIQLFFNGCDRSVRDYYGHINLKQLHEATKAWQRDHEESKKGKVSAHVDDPPLDTMFKLILLLNSEATGFTFETFVTVLLARALSIMAGDIFTLGQRQHGPYVERILATSGLHWNIHSNFKSRDFAQVALAASIESLIVPEYRPCLLTYAPGATPMRDDIRHAFSQMLNKIQSVQTAAMKELPLAHESVLEILDWDFADQFDSSNYPSTLPPTDWNHSDLQRDFDLSTKLQQMRDNNSLKKLFKPILDSPYIACYEPGILPGTIETSAHRLLSLLLSVSMSFILPFSRLPPRVRLTLACREMSTSVR